jgi:hypothetical protein
VLAALVGISIEMRKIKKIRVAGGATNEGKTHLPYEAKVRERIIIQMFYDFPLSFLGRFFSHINEGFY